MSPSLPSTPFLSLTGRWELKGATWRYLLREGPEEKGPKVAMLGVPFLRRMARQERPVPDGSVRALLMEAGLIKRGGCLGPMTTPEGHAWAQEVLAELPSEVVATNGAVPKPRRKHPSDPSAPPAS